MIKVMAVMSCAMAVFGAGGTLAAGTVDESTLVPLGLLVGAVSFTSVIAWKLATFYITTRHRLRQLEKWKAKEEKVKAGDEEDEEEVEQDGE